MKLEDMILISTDDHLIEPPDVFEGRLPKRLQDQAPRYIEANGVGYWELEGKRFPNIANAAISGRPPWEYGYEPNTHADLRKGYMDVHARVDDMNLNGQLAAIVYPQFMGHGGGTLREGKDKQLMLAINEAWNNWFIDEWCGVYPGRFIPMALMPVWDVQLCVRELKRVIAKGCRVIDMPPAPNRANLPSLHDPVWNPLWQLCNDEGVAIAMHIGDTSGPAPALEAPWEVWATGLPISLYNICADLLWSPILRNFPNLKFIMAEGGAGWVANFMERVDYVYKHQHFWTNQSFGDALPSEILRRHVIHSIIEDDVAIELRHRIGVETIAWEADYPHSDAVWPRGPESIWKSIVKHNVSKSDVDKITHLNVMKATNFDPFKHIKREEATVGALRAQAATKQVDPGYVFDHDNPNLAELPKHDPNRAVVSVGAYRAYMEANVKRATTFS